jgi:NTE family protein
MPLSADLVLEGGGVKGIGHVGAITALDEKGYTFKRVAGTSAGAIVASLVAAGMTPAAMLAEMQKVDYTQFRDPTDWTRLALPGELISVLLDKGLYRGDYFHDWIEKLLADQNIRTFGDLKIATDGGAGLGVGQSYKLVVMTADLSRGELVRLPWDYSKYGLEPDKQLVADAVRASMSIPFFFTPVKMNWSQTGQGCWLVDGGALSDFPIDVFESVDQQPPDRPTFGIKLSALPDANQVAHKISDTITFAEALLSTMMNAHDQMHLNDPCVIDRTIFVDTGNVQATDFDIDKATQQNLYDTGYASAQKFLAQWDWDQYRAKCPPPKSADAVG